MSEQVSMIRYVYTHMATEATTGYFSCEPNPAPSVEGALLALIQRPLDNFLRRHLITRMTAMGSGKAATVLRAAFPRGRVSPSHRRPDPGTRAPKPGLRRGTRAILPRFRSREGACRSGSFRRRGRPRWP